MPKSAISEEVLRLLREDLHGYAALETLILLSSQPGRDWSPSQISEELKIAEEEVGQALCELVRCDMAREVAPGSFTCQTEDQTRLDAVKALRRACEENRIEIMRIMSTHAIERVRNSAARAFADAFVIRKKNDG